MKIPIITDEGLVFLIGIINSNKVKTILEIGTAIGYSAIMLAEHVEHITTIEKNLYLAKIAELNFSDYQFKERITLINSDAFDVEITNKYDLIFIDAAKGQYEKFFTKFSKNLNAGGVIVCDNLNFHNLDINKVSKQTKKLLEKIESFKTFLKNNNDFSTSFVDVGDGMSISRRKDENTNNNS